MSGSGPRVLILLLLVLLFLGCGKSGIPDRTVVLTFDDGVTNHLTYVVPLLEELGFGATFFYTARWPKDRKGYLDFEGIAEIHRRGFEVGDHTVTHKGFHVPRMAKQLVMESEDMERVFGEHGIPKPASFAWPGNVFGPESLAVLRERGYRFARRGMSPEFPPGQVTVGPAYDPARHDPLLIPTAGDAHMGWSIPHFKRVIEQAKDGKAVVLQFHGVPDPHNRLLSTTPSMFRRLMGILDEGRYRVIAMRDLEKYVDPRPVPSDPMTTTRCPDEE
jgi:peptidoglycan/xylan/chitin deacetylase (PgdA/CDA1 family)